MVNMNILQVLAVLQLLTLPAFTVSVIFNHHLF